MVASMLVGGSFIDDADRLRAGSASAVLAFEPFASDHVKSRSVITRIRVG